MKLMTKLIILMIPLEDLGTETGAAALSTLIVNVILTVKKSQVSLESLSHPLIHYVSLLETSFKSTPYIRSTKLTL